MGALNRKGAGGGGGLILFIEDDGINYPKMSITQIGKAQASEVGRLAGEDYRGTFSWSRGCLLNRAATVKANPNFQKVNKPYQISQHKCHNGNQLIVCHLRIWGRGGEREGGLNNFLLSKKGLIRVGLNRGFTVHVCTASKDISICSNHFSVILY